MRCHLSSYHIIWCDMKSRHITSHHIVSHACSTSHQLLVHWSLIVSHCSSTATALSLPFIWWWFRRREFLPQRPVAHCLAAAQPPVNKGTHSCVHCKTYHQPLFHCYFIVLKSITKIALSSFSGTFSQNTIAIYNQTCTSTDNRTANNRLHTIFGNELCASELLSLCLLREKQHQSPSLSLPSHLIVSHHIISYYVTSHVIISHHMISHFISPYHIT